MEFGLEFIKKLKPCLWRYREYLPKYKLAVACIRSIDLTYKANVDIINGKWHCWLWIRLRQKIF